MTVNFIEFCSFKNGIMTGAALQRYQIAEVGARTASEAGYSHWYIDLSLPIETLESWDSNRIESIIKLCDELSISPIIHSNFKAPLAIDIETVRLAAISYIKQEIMLAKTLSAPLIIHAGAIVEPRRANVAKKIALDKFISSLTTILAFAKSKNVEIWLENLSNYKKQHPFYYIFTSPKEFEQIISLFPDIKLFIDIGHLNIGNRDLPNILTNIIHNIVGLSISNNDSLRDQHIDIESGTIDYSEIIQTLNNLNWSGLIGFEIRDQPPNLSLLKFHELISTTMNSNKK